MHEAAAIRAEVVRLLAVMPTYADGWANRDTTEGARLILTELLAYIDETPPPTDQRGKTFSQGAAHHA